MKYTPTTPMHVNWADGMKMSKKHFIQFEQAITTAISAVNSVHINDNNYGLLPVKGASNSPKISLAMDGHETVIVQLHECIAVTPGGHLIYIDSTVNSLLDESGLIISKKYQLTDVENYYIIVSVNPNKRIPVGESDPSEEPSRHPFVLPEYRLTVLPADEVYKKEPGQNDITVGKIIFDDNKAILADDYIPPCHSIQSHADLVYSYKELGLFFSRMEGYSIHIIQKIYQKKQTNDIAGMAMHVCQQTLSHLASVIGTARLRDRDSAPIEILLKVVNLARVIKSGIDIYSGTGKEQFLNYLTNWCDLNQGAFENTLQATIDLEYQHNDCNIALVTISEFTNLMQVLFKKLSELEYIGNRDDTKILVTTKRIDQDGGGKRRRSFMAD